MSEAPLISVCIPVFNGEVISLVKSLADQCESLENHVEIIVIDDCSDIDWKLKNESIKNSCNYIELEENIGRSKIRNLFLEHASGDYMLFIDGDSEIISKHYLSDYIDFIEKNKVDVLVGGRVNQKNRPHREQLLRWKYSIYRESKSAENRKTGFFGFQSNNFVIKKSVLQIVKFNEEFVGYGHEDTLFGIELKHEKANVAHIENPVLNSHLDSNEVFLVKTENAVVNLSKLYARNTQFPEIQEIKLICLYKRLSKLNLIPLFKIVNAIFLPIATQFLKKGYFLLWMFDFYKLGLFVRQIKV